MWILRGTHVPDSPVIPVTYVKSRSTAKVGALHRYTVLLLAIAFLGVGSAGIAGAGQYYARRYQGKAVAMSAVKSTGATLNKSVPVADLSQELERLSSQTAVVTVGDQKLTVPKDTLTSWFTVTNSSDGQQANIHVDAAKVAKSLVTLAQTTDKPAVNQISVTHDDGTTAVIASGSNGTKADTTSLASSANSQALGLLALKGMQVSAPVTVDTYKSVTPAEYPKLIEVNIVSKRMYFYENGKLVNTMLVSAGAPATPTPIGTYKIFEKLPVQDMWGYNPNGSRYFQPHVRWISYWKTGGYAIHGNYWRPSNWFGNINSSHGCVSVPDDLAKWAYDWAPIGTPVVTHE